MVRIEVMSVLFLVVGIVVMVGTAKAEPTKSPCKTVKVVQVMDFGAAGTDDIVAELRDENPGASIEVSRCEGALKLHPDMSCVRIVKACPTAVAAAKAKK